MTLALTLLSTGTKHERSLHKRLTQVKYYALLATALAACTQQRPVVLAPVRMEIPPADSSAPARQSIPVFDTQRDDPFATTNRIDWPGPNRYRSSAGAPGPDYWQQRADYTITAALDTGTTELTGSVEIRYRNNSPDTLRYVWIQADQNLYRTGSKGSALFPADSRWGVRGFQGGYIFTDVRVNGSSVQPRINDTMMRLDLPSPLAPRGGRATIAIRYSFKVPEHAAPKMSTTSRGRERRTSGGMRRAGMEFWPRPTTNSRRRARPGSTLLNRHNGAFASIHSCSSHIRGRRPRASPDQSVEWNTRCS